MNIFNDDFDDDDELSDEELHELMENVTIKSFSKLLFSDPLLMIAYIVASLITWYVLVEIIFRYLLPGYHVEIDYIDGAVRTFLCHIDDIRTNLPILIR